jgi:2-haloacid dehalogenase
VLDVMNSIGALAFDLYGTLVDPLRLWQQLEVSLGANARRAAEVWRQKQLEYTFRLTAMQRYEDFEQVTRRALDYALTAVGHDLPQSERGALLAAYDDLALFPDVVDGLRRLQNAGHAMVILSNGSPRMVQAAVRSASLESHFQALISVDEVRTYKPSPRVYLHAAERLGRQPAEVRLISSNPFDVIGAGAVGMQSAWLDRSGGLFDTLGPRPALVVTSLPELAERLERHPTSSDQ